MSGKGKDTFVIKQAHIVNEGSIKTADILIQNEVIKKIDSSIDTDFEEVNGEGFYLLPGIIDDQVHFREPGFTHKADIFSESGAAVAGGVTSYMEMPNVKPQTLTQKLLQEKYDIASKNSAANYSFYMGASNSNLEEVKKTDPQKVCGIKAFMGSSTGDMLLDDREALHALFQEAHILVAVHCESEPIIKKNIERYKEQANSVEWHPVIRSPGACYDSSSYAVQLAKKYNTRLHILHITTARETDLFEKGPVTSKQITSEVCVHHLTFTDRDYEPLGNRIKCNPAIKTEQDRAELWKAMLDDRIDVIATDHAPHTLEEKMKPYIDAPSGLPLIQHTLKVMLLHVKQGRLSMEKLVEKMCHAPAECFNIRKRGFIREGYYADLVLVDISQDEEVKRDNIRYKCGWSPLEGDTLPGKILTTWVNGKIAFDGRKVYYGNGERLLFDRPNV